LWLVTNILLKMDAPALFNTIKRANKTIFVKGFKLYMNEFGTSLPCNRFALGNLVEKLTIDAICSEGLKVTALPNEARYDCDIDTFGKLSIKYSSGGDITLHNSRSSVNKDMTMVDTLVITPKKWYLLIMSSIEGHGVEIAPYLKNNGDSLSLKASIFTELERIGYDYILDFDVGLDKKDCQNKEVNDIIADYIFSKIHAEE